MSDCSVTSSPWHCSGLMYSGVPMVMPVFVSLSFSISWIYEMPKSITYTRLSRVSMMFEGFTSRWTIPLLWA